MDLRISSRLSAVAATALVAGAALVVAATPAFAGAGIVETTVTPLQDNVTYSKDPLKTYVGYTVVIRNAGGNTINNIRFTAATSVSDPAEKATFSSAEGATCTAINTALTEIQCTIGQLTAGQPYPAIAIFFNAPAKNEGGGFDGLGTDLVTLTGTTYYAEGTGGINSTPDNSINEWATVPSVTLGTTNSVRVKSGAPKSNTNYTAFTGEAGVSKGNDKFTTLVTVPPSTGYTTVEIFEETFDSLTCSNFITCDQSQITIPYPAGTAAFSPYLTIVLRQDASNIRSGTKIGSVLINYIDAANVTHLVDDCGSPTQPRDDYLPCIAKRTYYKNKAVPGWTSDLAGDFEWELLNLGNGTYRFPR